MRRMMDTYRDALEAAREEITNAYVALGPGMYPDQDTLWALIADRADALMISIDKSDDERR